VEQGLRIDNSELLVDVLKPEYLNEILEIEQASFPVPWTRGMFRREMHIPFSHFYVLKEKVSGLVVAYGGFWLVRDEMHVTNLAVQQSWRHRGIGSRFLHMLLKEGRCQGAKEAILEVRPSNKPAEKLYKKLGFHQVGVRKFYYSDGEHALLMHRKLDREQKDVI